MGKKGVPPPPVSIPTNLRRNLLRWYRQARRDLPWRRTTDPYRIWVSEIMLQQTRVEAVIPYYERFLCRFPDVQSLAGASEQDVLAAWSGLGYYRRARMLRAAAAVVCERHDGTFPRDATAVQDLPGIGRYTAGAILSIAFSQCEPVLDGNVMRVLTRILRLPGDPKRNPLQTWLWELARELVQGKAPGDVNQALMELGATICLPGRAARCETCPVRRSCAARAAGEVERYPELAKPAELVEETWFVAFCQRRGRVLVRRREDEPLLNGMWELPTQVASHRETAADALARFFARRGITARVGSELLTHRQTISGRSITFRVFEVVAQGTSPAVRWLYRSQILEKPVTTATRKILQKTRPRDATDGP